VLGRLNFAKTEFSEVHQEFIRNSSPLGREGARPPIMREHSKQGNSGGA